MMLRIVGPRWNGSRWGLELAVRRFLRARQRSYLSRLLNDSGLAVAAAVSLAAVGTAGALPPVELADVAGGNGGFVMNGITVDDFCGKSVAGAGDVNGDGLADVIVGAWGRRPERPRSRRRELRSFRQGRRNGCGPIVYRRWRRRRLRDQRGYRRGRVGLQRLPVPETSTATAWPISSSGHTAPTPPATPPQAKATWSLARPTGRP